MADTLLFRFLKSQPKHLKLNNQKLEKIPKLIGKLEGIRHLDLKNNKLKDLPEEVSQLFELEILNLGNNEFEEIPECVLFLTSLTKIHLFGNKIYSINPSFFDSLENLTFLNLNGNELTQVPPEICRLGNLQFLSIDNNKIEELPVEFCALTHLIEVHLAGNRIHSLPLEFGFLNNLERLYLLKNKIRELPESIGKCYKLRILDIAANELRIFPTEIANLPLKELHCEENPLLQHVPVHSVQEEEVLALKEITARFVMKELKDRWSYLRKRIRHYPDIRDMLSQSSKCALCGESFLNTWLECVQFISTKQNIKVKNMSGLVPVRALLCSYKCFNSPGHDYYGVAFP
ncbi:hypothetical protein LOTGIDRAFT_221760 [Lottia gigantea]|uniref:Disease resistance R13L4/SHOC-2-like LRR domain-containing protein n=1 Tax=Lottia gigantea TaxID=225164 RepID=V3ZVB5_LOTGI|nr:hypothetical protein LOTGIDRAFT_221760 [Lottia gigantea]ESO84851.1 hypothetical protein LOTGIDRAFT_221760 [Lottia gigantea]